MAILVRKTHSFIIPASELTLSEQSEKRATVSTLLIEQALKLAIKNDEGQLIIRDTLPDTDLGLAAAGGWRIPGAGAAGVEQQYWSLALPVDRCIGVYGASVESAAPGIQRVRVGLGNLAAGLGEVRGVYQLEKLYTPLEPRGYFSESVLFLRQETYGCLVIPRIAFAAASERLELLSRTVEPRGLIVSGSSV